MKRLFNLFLLLTVFVVKAMATDYPIVVKGVTVSSSNASNVLGDGTVKYDDATKTLTLKNANLSGVSDVIHDYDNSETITIDLIGNNTIKADYDALSSDGASYIITGDGTLNVNGIYLDEGNLTIKDKANVNVLKSTSYAVNLRGADLSVLDNAELNAEGNGKDETFWGIGKLTLGKGFLVHPINLSYSSTKQSIVDDAGNRTKGDVKIYNANSLKKYALEIEGVQLNEFNASDPCGDGSVKYDDATWTLTLNNANLSGVSDVITDYRDNLSWLNIVLKGTNTIKANLTALRTDGSNVTIKGDGTLNVNGINLDEGNLAIRESAKVNVLKSNLYAINLRGANLTVLDNSELTVEGNGKDETVWGIKNLYLEDGYAVSPKNISYSSTKQTFVDENGNATKGDIKIAQAPYDPAADLYDLWIAGTQVSAANANDVFGDGTVKVAKKADRSGDYFYVYLTNANIVSSSTSQKGVIYCKSNMKFGYNGNCRIEAQGEVNAAIYCEKYVSFPNSRSTLNVKSQWNGIIAQSVEIGAVNMNIEGVKGRGIHGFWGDQEGSLKVGISTSVVKVKGGIADFAEITIDDVTKMEADADICIYDFGGVNSHDCGIVTNDSQHNLYRDEITFSHGPSGHLYLADVNGRRTIGDSFTETNGTGTVSYDKDSKTITFNNWDQGCDVDSYVDGLTIELIGKNYIFAFVSGDTRIIGDGINRTKLASGGIIIGNPIGKDVNITIEDVVINEDEVQWLFNFKEDWNIWGDDLDNVVNLKLVNCSINARLNEYAHLHTPIIFEGCKFSGYSEEPKFDSEKGTYLNSSGQPLTRYDITPFQKYTLTFKTTLMYNDGTVKDGEIISTSEVMEGDPITAPEPPVIPGMEFTNWAPGVLDVMPAYNATYTAMYKEIESPEITDVNSPTVTDDKITVNATTDSSISISWMAASDDCTTTDKLEYVVEITDVATGTTKEYAAGNANQYDITGLEADVLYSINVIVRDEAGNINHYDAIEVRTNEVPDVTAPTVVDSKITVDDVTENNISISWKSATDDRTAESNLMYTIGYKVSGTSAMNTISIGNATSYTITGLESATTYVVVVTVDDEAGNSASYEEIEIETVDPNGIIEIMTDNPDATMHNIQGLSVGEGYRGVVIRNGKKCLKTK